MANQLQIFILSSSKKDENLHKLPLLKPAISITVYFDLRVLKVPFAGLIFRFDVFLLLTPTLTSSVLLPNIHIRKMEYKIKCISTL